jgi:hypothetical protein
MGLDNTSLGNKDWLLSLAMPVKNSAPNPKEHKNLSNRQSLSSHF